MKVNLTILLLIVVMGFGNYYLFSELKQSRENYNRILESFSSVQTDLQLYMTQGDDLAAKMNILELNTREIKKVFPQVIKDIESLDIKLGRVNNYSNTVIHHEKEIVKELRDSVVLDTIQVKVFDYTDEFYNVTGNILEDSIRMNIVSTDSIIQVVYRGKRPKPWLWFFSPRPLEQVIQSKNPDSKIIYSKNIQITK
jgi:hypothetical protein